jgi:ABC-type Mn2+/Zn2+ transport system ATPase subunit
MTWQPDLDALRFRLARGLAERGHDNPTLAAAVLVDRGRARQDRQVYARGVGLSLAQLRVVEEPGVGTLPASVEAVFRRRLRRDLIPRTSEVRVMNETLLAEVEGRLYRAGLAEDVADLVLTACVAPEDLGTAHASRSPGSPGEVVAAPLPPSTFLAKISVEGFRGIGAPVELRLKPGPGLTLVVGRNGTAKSSISDALEVLLTGSTARLRLGEKNKAWLDGWRNLHHPDPVRLSADFVVEGQPGFVTVTREWAASAGLEDATTTVARAGKPKAAFASLGWDGALATYRPFLPYSELGGLLDVGPSRLFDTLNAILGLGDLAAAAGALREQRLTMERQAKEAGEALKMLRASLAGVDDPRASAVLAATARRVVDLEAVAAVVASPVGLDEDLDGLRRLAAVEPPDVDALSAAAERVRAAVAGVTSLAGSDAGDALRVAELLHAAMEIHGHRGDGACPVCKTGVLDSAWRSAAVVEEERLRAAAASALTARRELEAATAAARALLRPPPAGVSGHAFEQWAAWAGYSASGSGDELAAHLDSAAGFAAAVTELAVAAAAEVAAREDRWRPFAGPVAAWLVAAETAVRQAPLVKQVKAAEDWLKAVEGDIRNERFEPLAKAAGRVWEALRMRSSVDIGGIELAGTATKRRVVVDVTVDGISAGALGVMSQGELHSLALSLFLPRATLDESPFRFVIIDDPVQAMDPAKVEGLARVLEETARTRQVIVLTHDDRLDEVVRRLDIDATVIEVSRGARSVVTCSKTLDPVERRLRDARTVAMEEGLPSEVKGRVVPTLCRQAVEAAARDVVRSRRLGRGESHQQVEDDIEAAGKLRQVVALALFDAAEKAGEVVPKLGRLGKTIQRCDAGAHEGDRGDLLQLVEDSRALVKKISA